MYIMPQPVKQVIQVPFLLLFKVTYIHFVLQGEYAGFDEKQLTCQNGGKGQVMTEIKKKHDMYVYSILHVIIIIIN